jgi:hypothetical protein
VEETIHDVVISPMPRTDPTMLRETDRVARSLLAVATAAVPSVEAEDAESTSAEAASASV